MAKEETKTPPTQPYPTPPCHGEEPSDAAIHAPCHGEERSDAAIHAALSWRGAQRRGHDPPKTACLVARFVRSGTFGQAEMPKSNHHGAKGNGKQ